MKRTELFQLYVATAVSGNPNAVRILAAIQDPNVQTAIEQGKDESVEKKANAYLNWVYGSGKRPFWFVISTEDNEHKTPERFSDLKAN